MTPTHLRAVLITQPFLLAFLTLVFIAAGGGL